MWAVRDVAADGIRSTLHLATKLLANGQCGVCVILTRLRAVHAKWLSMAMAMAMAGRVRWPNQSEICGICK